MIYINNKFTGFWPIGTSAVVSANSSEEAACFLNNTLEATGLEKTAKPEDMIEFHDIIGNVKILNDGAY